MAQLSYVMDPMCSWCWAFRPTIERIAANLPDNMPLRYVMGGLAPDSDVPMPMSMQHSLQQTWANIAERTGTKFNFDFWTECKPRRSTYPACRAVLAAGKQGEVQVSAMISAIQRAYYLEARNPSDAETLVTLAGEIGLDRQRFASDLASAAVGYAFADDLALAQSLGAQGFPSLLWEHNGATIWLARGYSPPEPVLARLSAALQAAGMEGQGRRDRG